MILQQADVGQTRLFVGPVIVRHIIMVAHNADNSVASVHFSEDILKLKEFFGVVVDQVARKHN